MFTNLSVAPLIMLIDIGKTIRVAILVQSSLVRQKNAKGGAFLKVHNKNHSCTILGILMVVIQTLLNRRKTRMKRK